MEFTLTHLMFNISSCSRYRTLGFMYLFLYLRMEFTLTFLTHLRFNFTSHMEQVGTLGFIYLFLY